MPAEWTIHNALWLAWPHDKISFGSLNEPEGKPDTERLSRVEARYVEIIKAVYRDETVKLLVLDTAMEGRVKDMLRGSGVDNNKINFIITDYADVWIRDYGPSFVKNEKTGEIGAVKWNYYSYGGKFPTLLKDDKVFDNLKAANFLWRPGIFMEGGAIEGNGRGVLVTTEECLLNPNRNPELDRMKIEKILKDHLGVEKIIWLQKGLINDHTDGHVDDLVKFIEPNTIVCAYEDSPSDPNFEILEKNFEILKNSTDQNGNPFRLIKLPMPRMDYRDGNKAPASYTNFYIGNKTVLVPVFRDVNDELALNIIRSCFPTRKVVGIESTDIVYGGGALHCITKEEPL